MGNQSQSQRQSQNQKQRGVGRPTILEREGLSLAEVFLTYQEEGSYGRVATRLGVAERSVGTYVRLARRLIHRRITRLLSERDTLRGTNLSVPTRIIREWHLSRECLPEHAVMQATLYSGRTISIHLRLSRQAGKPQSEEAPR